MFKKYLFILFAVFLLFGYAYAEMGDEATLGAANSTGAYRWRVTTDGNLIPGTTNSYDIGNSTYRVKDVWLQGNQTVAGYETISGNMTFQGTLVSIGIGSGGVSEAVTGAKNTTGESYSVYNLTIETNTTTVGDGKVGQMITFSAKKWSDTGTATITPLHAIGFTSITMDTVADSVTLLYTAAGWVLISNSGGTVVGN
jgi:hypothetical protein